MSGLAYLRPASLAEALAMAPPDTEGRMWLAGGQSLIAAMKLGLAQPAALIDLQDVPQLRDIRRVEDAAGAPALWIGAMATHASVAASEAVRGWAPGLAALAGGIGDAQVRNMGTIGGSLAHNDPAACWPAGVLAAGATIVTSRREIAVDDWFAGLYVTALQAGELIAGIRFPRVTALHYLKFEQPASRFALVGVAVARLGPDGRDIRVAVTGLGRGAVRWPAAERALAARFGADALASLSTDMLDAVGDLHASAAYRCHLARVLARRCVAAITGEALPAPAPLSSAASAPRVAAAAAGGDGSAIDAAGAATQDRDDAPPRDGFGGHHRLDAPPRQVWRTLLDPRALQAGIPGCESLTQTGPDTYAATVKVGLGPLSVRFRSDVTIRDPREPESMTLVFRGDAGALGSGEGTAQVRLEPVDGGATRLHWRVRVSLGGRLAQFGNRLVEATARSLSETFFDRLGATLSAGAPAAGPSPADAPVRSGWRRLLARFLPFLRP